MAKGIFWEIHLFSGSNYYFNFNLIYQFETIMEPKKAQKYGIIFMIQTSFIVPLYAY